MKNKFQKNNKKNHDQISRSRLIKCGSLFLISLFIVLCTIIPSFASSGEYEIEDVSIITIVDSSYNLINTFSSPFILDDDIYSPGDYIFEFSFDYIDSYPDGYIRVYSNNNSVLQDLKNANSGDGSIYDGYYELSFGYLVGNAYITIPGSLIVKPTILDNLFSIFSGIGSWIASIFTSLIGVFYVNGSLTVLGSLAVVSVGFGIAFLLLMVISRFLRFRG